MRTTCQWRGAIFYKSRCKWGGGGYNDMDCMLAFVGRKFALTFDVVWKEGRLDLRDLIVLKGAFSEMGSAHKACGFVVTLWAHLWVDYMWGLTREWGILSAFGEGRH